ncbi:hypothetical protein CONLIGDRAFT_687556 [Coniochaeta ligniaria NRRL 30616]|uniref:Uncharacterized protein n=1 Tax=Coniochaeta ligniaria NRRL 30616 TaxID=1408157 RepID=A0A1J7I4H3_9PEZI|nr:hypothetical protein CONLIGDRAFT_687556 [Coniochaeta ligniaria NRRL 30616]
MEHDRETILTPGDPSGQVRRAIEVPLDYNINDLEQPSALRSQDSQEDVNIWVASSYIVLGDMMPVSHLPPNKTNALHMKDELPTTVNGFRLKNLVKYDIILEEDERPTSPCHYFIANRSRDSRHLLEMIHNSDSPFKSATGTVHFTSLPWRTAEQEGAIELEQEAEMELAQSAIGMILQQNEAMQALNVAAARHSQLTTLIVREPGDMHLIGESRERLNTVMKLTHHMEDLINPLLHYAHVGRAYLTVSDVDLNDVVERVKRMSKEHQERDGTRLCIPLRLPMMHGGVADNGIDIRKRHYYTVFNL